MSGVLSRGCSYSPPGSFEYTSLQAAAKEGYVDEVR